MADLQRRVKALTILNVKLATDTSNLDSDISELRNREPRVFFWPGGITSVGPRSWGYASATSCPPGAVIIGGGFSSNYSVEIQKSNGDASGWHIAAYNPYLGGTAIVSSQAVCLSW
jgi:hypothetical protein